MGLISYEPIDDGVPATGNLFNERFAKIYNELNGNIASVNLTNGAVTTAKIADGAVTSSKISISKYVDDNGWTVIDYGTHKQYMKTFVTSGTLTLGEGTRGEIGNTEPPVGRTRNNILLQTTWYGGYSGHVILGCEDSGATKITCQIAHNWASPLTMNGRAVLIATDAL